MNKDKPANFKSRLNWVPNFFTLSNLSLGFIAILVAGSSNGDRGFLMAAGAFIFLAMLCDGLDGFAARILNARSELGAQLDSLADLCTFGIAPAVMMYFYLLSDYNMQLPEGTTFPTGMLISVVYPACAAYRLARFNMVHDEDSFVGLPSPIAGVIVGLMPVAFGELIQIPEMILIIIFILCGFLMVSTIRYSKPQVTMARRFSRGRLALVFSFLIGFLVFVGWQFNFEVSAAALFTLAVVYILVGIVSFLIHTIQELRV